MATGFLGVCMGVSTFALVVHGNGAAAQRRRRNKLEAPRGREPALVERGPVAGDAGMDQKPVVVDQVETVQRGGEPAGELRDEGVQYSAGELNPQARAWAVPLPPRPA